MHINMSFVVDNNEVAISRLRFDGEFLRNNQLRLAKGSTHITKKLSIKNKGE